MLLRSKLFLLSPAPHSSNARGRWPKCCAWGHESPEDNAALSQTVLMPLANATYPMLKGSDPNAKLGAIIVLEVNAGDRLSLGGRSYLTLRLYLR